MACVFVRARIGMHVCDRRIFLFAHLFSFTQGLYYVALAGKAHSIASLAFKRAIAEADKYNKSHARLAFFKFSLTRTRKTPSPSKID